MIEMEEKYLEIDLREYIPLNSYVILDSEFVLGLFRNLITKFGSVTCLANKIGADKASIYDWMRGRVRIPLKKLIKCTKIVGMSKTELFKSVIDITALYNAGSILVRNWKLILNENLSEWLGLLRGDGTISEKYIGCTNASLDVSVFFADIIEKNFGVPKSHIEITIEIPPNKNLNQVQPIVKLLSNKGYDRIVERKCKKGRKILISPRVSSKVLAQLLKKLVKGLHPLIKTSPNNVKAAYVRGFAAAEGSPHQCRSVRAVSFSSRNRDELEFIKNLLHDIGIIHVSDPEPIKKGIHTTYKIKITTQSQLRLFNRKVGFGKHIERNEKLANILKGYKKTLTRIEYKSKFIRFDEILRLIKSKGKMTAKQIAIEINLSYSGVNMLLLEMLSKKLIHRTGGWPYLYHSEN